MISKAKPLLTDCGQSRALIHATALTVAYLALSLWSVFRQTIDFTPERAGLGMQLADLGWIRENPWNFLIYYHYQPPLYNFFLGLLYILRPQSLVAAVITINLLLSVTAFIGMLIVANQLKIGQIWIALIGWLAILYPVRVAYETMIFYTMPSMGLLGLLLIFFYVFLRTKKVAYFALMAAAALLLPLINPFFHFTWTIATLIGAALLSSACKQKPIILITILFSALALVVPLKNWIVFDVFTSSTSGGIVAIQRVCTSFPMRLKHAARKETGPILWPYSSELYLKSGYPIPSKFRNVKWLSRPYKDFDGSHSDCERFNYNYYTMIPVMKSLIRDSIFLTIRYPVDYWRGTRIQFGEFFSAEERLKSLTRTRFAPRGVLYLLSLFGICFFLRGQRSNKDDAYRTICFILAQILYGLVIGVFICMCDAMRYRFCFETYFLLIAGFCLTRLLPKKRRF